METLIKYLEDRHELQAKMHQTMYPGIPFPHDVMCNRAGYKQAIIDIEQFFIQKGEKNVQK